MAIADLYDDRDPLGPYAPQPAPVAVTPTDRSALPAPVFRQDMPTAFPAAPAVVGPQWQKGGVDPTKWADPTHKTSKYEVLRILDQWNPNQLGRAGLLALSPEQRRQLEALGYQIRDEDKIFRNDIGEVDVLHGDRTEYGWRNTGVGNIVPRKATSPRFAVDSGHGNDRYMPDGRPNPNYRPPATTTPRTTPPGTTPPGTTPPGGRPDYAPPTPPYTPQFTDPLTAQYEKLLASQTALYQQQQQQMQAQAQQADARRAQAQARADQLMRFAEERQAQLATTPKSVTDIYDQFKQFTQGRVSDLQKPAYTGSEQEVIRTQYLDPIERDRAATRRRALDNIGSRGFDPSSGIAQDLLNQVDRGYDTQRAQAQGDIAYRQINEERSRQQEAQQLLDSLSQGERTLTNYGDSRRRESQQISQYLAQLPDAVARGDVDFVNHLMSLINQPGQNAIATSAMLSDLPVQRAQLGAQILGLGGQPQSGVPGAMQLLQNAQYNRLLNQNQTADFWRNLGQSFLS